MQNYFRMRVKDRITIEFSLPKIGETRDNTYDKRSNEKGEQEWQVTFQPWI